MTFNQAVADYAADPSLENAQALRAAVELKSLKRRYRWIGYACLLLTWFGGMYALQVGITTGSVILMAAPLAWWFVFNIRIARARKRMRQEAVAAALAQTERRS